MSTDSIFSSKNISTAIASKRIEELANENRKILYSVMGQPKNYGCLRISDQLERFLKNSDAKISRFTCTKLLSGEIDPITSKSTLPVRVENAEDFLSAFKKTEHYQKTFGSRNLDLEINQEVYEIPNFANIGITVNTKPTFTIFKKGKKEIIGFVEFQPRGKKTHLLNNIYHIDVMKVALCSLIKKGVSIGNASCWIIQLSEKDVTVDEFRNQDIIKAVEGMHIQLHKSLYYKRHTKTFDDVASEFRYKDLNSYIEQFGSEDDSRDKDYSESVGFDKSCINLPIEPFYPKDENLQNGNLQNGNLQNGNLQNEEKKELKMVHIITGIMVFSSIFTLAAFLTLLVIGAIVNLLSYTSGKI